MEDDKYYDILLKEYEEAGVLCRNYEQLMRTSLTLFTPFATVLIGFLLTGNLNNAANFTLSVVGSIIALLLWNTVKRQQAYYLSYLVRVKDIEKLILRDGNPVMSLYTGAESACDGLISISNKSTIASIFIIAASYFSLSAIVYGYKFIVC